LNIPAWAEFDSYYVSLKYFPYAEQEKNLHEMLDQFLIRYLMDNNAIEWSENYSEIEKII